jgi:hypothetical protein
MQKKNKNLLKLDASVIFLKKTLHAPDPAQIKLELMGTIHLPSGEYNSHDLDQYYNLFSTVERLPVTSTLDTYKTGPKPISSSLTQQSSMLSHICYKWRICNLLFSKSRTRGGVATGN